MLVRSSAVDVVVIDSVAALTPKAEIEGEMGDSHVGLQARLMSQALRKLTANIKKSGTLVIFINQIRMKIGVMFGSPETTTGGNALKFYASVRLDIRRIGAVKRGEEVVGIGDARQSRQEQGRAAVPAGRVRDSLRRRHIARGRADRAWRQPQPRREIRRVVQLQRRADRAGQGQYAALSQGASGDIHGDRRAAARQAAEWRCRRDGEQCARRGNRRGLMSRRGIAARRNLAGSHR